MFKESEFNSLDFFNNEFKMMQGDYTIEVNPTTVIITFSFYAKNEEKIWSLIISSLLATNLKIESVVNELKIFKAENLMDHGLDDNNKIYRFLQLLNA